MEGSVMVLEKGKEFGDLLLEKRREKNLSLQKLSNEIGGEVTPSYINRLEKKEKNKPSFDVVCQLTKALEMDLAEVFASFGYGSMMPPDQPHQVDMMISDHQGNFIAVECKTSSTHLSAKQAVLLQETVQSVVGYAMADWEDSYGYISNIVQLVEDFRKESRK